MAQKVVVSFLDDIDGSEADGTVSFAVDGVAYEIDLNAKNTDKLHKALAPFIAHARKSGKVKGAGRRGNVSPIAGGKASDAAVIREWAAANSIEVPAKGRVPQAVREQWEAAQSA